MKKIDIYKRIKKETFYATLYLAILTLISFFIYLQDFLYLGIATITAFVSFTSFDYLTRKQKASDWWNKIMGKNYGRR